MKNTKMNTRVKRYKKYTPEKPDPKKKKKEKILIVIFAVIAAIISLFVLTVLALNQVEKSDWYQKRHDEQAVAAAFKKLETHEITELVVKTPEGTRHVEEIPEGITQGIKRVGDGAYDHPGADELLPAKYRMILKFGEGNGSVNFTYYQGRWYMNLHYAVECPGVEAAYLNIYPSLG